ncbi:MAG TPA: phosphotransferase [Terracidiphilus sp.]|nr:phosphotransferase [Terracidiphilus sp.]
MTTTAKTHGLNGTLVEPDWAPLEAAEMRVLLEQYGIMGTVRIESVSPRPFSAASVVRAGGERVFVKRHPHAVRDAVGIAEEHAFLAHLLDHGANVPRVLSTRAGATAVELDAWTYEVHAIPAGVDVYEEALSWTPYHSAAHARAAGAALAQLHQAAANYTAPARKVQPLVASFSIFASNDTASAMERYLAERPALVNDGQTRIDCERALELFAPLHDELRPCLPGLAPLWTHNDLHGSNLLWTDGDDQARVTAVIDFGLADRTNAVHDLAHAVERSVVEWLKLTDDSAHVPVHYDQLFALLEGYEQVRTLTDTERNALAPMAALCHAEFALTEADYFLGVLHSPERARVATEDYLAGHAQWWCGPGRTMLDTLRRWAEAR